MNVPNDFGIIRLKFPIACGKMLLSEEKPVVKNKSVVKTTPKKKITIPSNKKWVGTLFKCRVGCLYAYWDSAGNNYDEKMNRVFN